MRFSLAWAVILLCVSPLWAVHTSHWTQTTQADFKAGTFHNTVVSNLGDVELSRKVKTLLRQDPRVSAVYALAQAPDGSIYAATGPRGVLLRYKDGEVSTAATLSDDVNLLSLLVDDHGRVLIGTGGHRGRILAIDKPGDKPREIFSAQGVQYVWAMCRTPDGRLYAATGPNGRLFLIDKNGKATQALKTQENNLLALAFDGKKSLYIGTDPNGLIYRLDTATGKAFVLYDASESEIGALALDEQGNLYAATSDAVGQSVRGVAPEMNQQIGRPEGAGAGAGSELPSQPPKLPTPPPMPNPNPGQPPPIPKHRQGSTQPSGSRGTSAESDEATAGLFIHPYLFAATDVAQSHPMADAPDGMDDGDGEQAAPPTGDPNEGEADKPVSLRPEQPSQGSPMRPGARGNAIYRITPDGFVTEIFRGKVMVMSLLQHEGTLLAGTGSEGMIYQINPRTRETIVVADVDPKQVMCLLGGRDGTIYLGTANVGGLATMSSGYAEQGAYTSAVLDASQTSRFGLLQMHGTLPLHTSLSVATRSGNTGEPDATGWSDWSEEIPASQFIRIQSPSARYLQYRVTFKTTDPKQTPRVEDVDAAYLLPNLPPSVRAVKVSGPDSSPDGRPPQASPERNIAWQANDPNDDALTYALYYRRGVTGPWLLMAKNLKTPRYAWDTRTVADGRYQVKVVASDAAANPPGRWKSDARISDPVTIDNTPPVIGNIESNRDGTALELSFTVVDRTSTVAAAAYRIDSDKHWQAVFPSDRIFDGPAESIATRVDALEPGAHQITIRAADAFGNLAYETLAIGGSDTTPPQKQPTTRKDQ